jgi:HEAT repeat protein
MTRTFNVFLLVCICTVFTIAGAGCKKGTPTTCKGWAKLLKSPVKGRDAIKNLGELRCKESLSALEEVFPSSQYKDQLLQSVHAINAPLESVSLLKKALADPEAAVQAAAVVEDFAIPELRQPLLDVLTSDVSYKARENALKALIKLDGGNLKQDEDLLIALVRNDPNLQGIQVNALAARTLGEMKSVKAIPSLIVGLFMRTQRGEAMYTHARKALTAIGKPAVTILVATLAGDKNVAAKVIEDLSTAGKKLGIYEWQWQDGPEMVQVLGDLRDTAAAAALVANLGKALNPPTGVDDRVTRSWQIAQQNRITMGMMALWNVGTAEVVPAMKAIIENQSNDAKQRLDTASAMAMLPGFVGIDAALQIFQGTKLETFKAPLVKPIILGIDWKRFPTFMKLLKADKSSLVKERFLGEEADALEFQAMASVLTDCKEGDVDCLIAKLKGDNLIAAEKAAILMTTLTGDAAAKALKALLARYTTIDPVQAVDMRRFVMLAIWRLGDKTSVPEVKALLKADKDRKGAGYWVDELETLVPAMAAK